MEAVHRARGVGSGMQQRGGGGCDRSGRPSSLEVRRGHAPGAFDRGAAIPADTARRGIRHSTGCRADHADAASSAAPEITNADDSAAEGIAKIEAGAAHGFHSTFGTGSSQCDTAGGDVGRRILGIFGKRGRNFGGCSVGVGIVADWCIARVIVVIVAIAIAAVVGYCMRVIRQGERSPRIHRQRNPRRQCSTIRPIIHLIRQSAATPIRATRHPRIRRQWALLRLLR
mmetsp:Transcript_14485/g.31171  ORF Transcript_14485/g.31171 Transcript_14485/m.31171 type:complete len:228 (-) Transcript_14485:580-1263(-)